MKSIKSYFNPISIDGIAEVADRSLAKKVAIYTQEFPDWKKADIALLRLCGSGKTTENNIRQAFYVLKEFSSTVNIVDLGDLLARETFRKNCNRLASVCDILIKHRTTPILIAPEHSLDYGQFLAYKKMGRKITFLNIDAMLDATKRNKKMQETHIGKIFSHYPEVLKSYYHLAHQRYLCSDADWQHAKYVHCRKKSVGQIRNNHIEVEPDIRAADMLSFDLSSIKAADLSATAHRRPFGLTGEEACHLCLYAGASNQLTSAGFYGYLPEIDKDMRSAMVVATMIWYFVEGFCNRKQEYNFQTDYYMKYIVEVAKHNEQIIFYKSKITDRWWVEIDDKNIVNEQWCNHKNFVPCSYNDYLLACKGVLPERWALGMKEITNNHHL